MGKTCTGLSMVTARDEFIKEALEGQRYKEDVMQFRLLLMIAFESGWTAHERASASPADPGDGGGDK